MINLLLCSDEDFVHAFFCRELRGIEWCVACSIRRLGKYNLWVCHNCWNELSKVDRAFSVEWEITQRRKKLGV